MGGFIHDGHIDEIPEFEDMRCSDPDYFVYKTVRKKYINWIKAAIYDNRNFANLQDYHIEPPLSGSPRILISSRLDVVNMVKLKSFIDKHIQIAIREYDLGYRVIEEFIKGKGIIYTKIRK